MTPETCPNCGADVPPKAKACPECGADETTGWAEDAYASKLDLPDDEFDYEEFVKEEFGQEQNKIKPRGIHWLWWVIALLVLIAFLFGWVL